jgi:hypothetical protein
MNVLNCSTNCYADWPAYLCGCAGTLAEWRSYGVRNGKGFRYWSAVGALLWAGQYFLLGAWTAGLTIACTALRTVLSGLIKQPHHQHRMAAAFIALFAAITAVSWQGLISLLPALAVINTTLALFYLDNLKMRTLLILSSVAWISNDYYWQAWPALIAESVAVLINLRTISKLLKAKKLVAN